MRIYEVRRNGRATRFARSFDQAKAVVKEDDHTARKMNGNQSDVIFSNGMGVHAIEIKPDKEGIINKLNGLLEEPTSPFYLAQPEPEPEPIPEEEPVAVETIPVGISPAIEFTGKGSGTCLHCNKTVGYVGGFPRVNPPEELRDH